MDGAGRRRSGPGLPRRSSWAAVELSRPPGELRNAFQEDLSPPFVKLYRSVNLNRAAFKAGHAGHILQLGRQDHDRERAGPLAFAQVDEVDALVSQVHPEKLFQLHTGPRRHADRPREPECSPQNNGLTENTMSPLQISLTHLHLLPGEPIVGRPERRRLGARKINAEDSPKRNHAESN